MKANLRVSALKGFLVKRKKSQVGFTLIELVIVIVILGILAAVALPRFVTLGTDARKATVDGMYGSVLAAANLAHSVYLVTGGAPTSITMEGATVDMVNGYPAATATGIGNAVKDATGFTPTTGTTGFEFRVTGAAAPTSCMVTYAAAASGGTPTVATVKTDCS